MACPVVGENSRVRVVRPRLPSTANRRTVDRAGSPRGSTRGARRPYCRSRTRSSSPVAGRPMGSTDCRSTGASEGSTMAKPPRFRRVRLAGVAFDVTHDGDQMAVLLHRDSLESPLPDSPDGLVPRLVPLHVCGHDPVHPPSEVEVREWAQDEVEMVRHETPRENSHGDARAGPTQERHECFVVQAVVKNPGPPIPSVQHVVADVSS